MSERSLFIRALEIDDPAQRAELLSRECGDDDALRHRIEKLLSAHTAAGGILDNPPVTPPATDLFRPITEGPGTVIGPYKLLQQIGEGGFGVVYMAEQQRPVRRKVALKIIKPGMDTREVIARFESERQALALMDHPNIARVLDGGTTDSGRPYFVMELVKGVPLTQFCDDNKLDTRERLKLFSTVCKAIQHAHHKGVIHRDIKPSNVMVTLHDGQPVPKVIDFGVSKAISQQLTEKTMFTAYGQMIGTPAYMSPEQAEMSGLDIDTRSDVYSLGVLLYELLTGSTPLGSESLRGKAYAELQRMIREDEPPRPSLRVSTLGEATAQIAAQRGTVPRELGALLRGELDWIVMKALEKNRDRRYESANTFAADVERYLKHEAIEACPPSPLYRARKFIRRNRVACTTGTLIAVSLLTATLISAMAARDALYQRRLAEDSLRLAFADREAAEKAQKNTVSALETAERERDRAEKAKAEESKQRQTAEQQRLAAEAAEKTAATERLAAVQERDKATAISEELAKQKEQQRRLLYVAQMNLIQTAWNDNNISRVKQLLNNTRPQPDEADLRSIEWHYWQRMLHQEDHSYRLPVDLISLASPTRTTLANAALRSTSSSLTSSFARWLRFSTDGMRLAAIGTNEENPSAGYVLRVWNTAAGHKEPILTHSLAHNAGVVRRPGTTLPPSMLIAGVEVSFLDAHRVVVGRQKGESRFGLGSESQFTPSSQRTGAEMELISIPLASMPGDSPLKLSTFTVQSPLIFSHDGTHLATVAHAPSNADPPAETKILILDGVTGATLDEYPSPFLNPALHAVSDDGKRLVLSDLTQRRINVRENSAASPSIEVLIVNVESRQSTPLQSLQTSQNFLGVFGTLIFEFSPNLTYLAVARAPSQAWPTTLQLFDTATGREIPLSSNLSSSLATGRFGKNVLAFSADSQWLVSNVTNDNDLRKLALCHVQTGRQVMEYKGHADSPILVTFSADGKQLLSTDAGGEVKVWRVPDSVPDQSPSLEQIRGRSRAFSPSRSTLTASSPDGRWTAVAPRSADADGLISTTDFPAEPPYELKLTDRGSRDAPPHIFPLCGPARSLVYSPDSSLLAVLAIDPAAKLEEAAELQLFTIAAGQRLPLAIPRFAVQHFDISRSPSARAFPATSYRTFPGTNPVFSPDSQRLTILGAALLDGKQQQQPAFHLLDLKQGRVVKVAHNPLQPGSASILSYEGTFSPDGKLLLLSSGARAVLSRSPGQRVSNIPPRSGLQVMDATTGGFLWEDKSSVMDAVFSGDSRVLVGLVTQTLDGGGNAFSVVSWQADTGQEKRRFELPSRQAYTFLTSSPDGSKVAVRYQGTQHMVYEIGSGKLLYTLSSPTNGLIVTRPEIAFTPDGRRLLNVPLESQSSAFIRSSPASEFTELTEAKVWDAHTGQEVLSITSESPLFVEFKSGRAARGLTPLPPATQVEELVHWLETSDKNGQLPTLAEFAQLLEADTTVSEDVRRLAIQAVRQHRNPTHLISLAANLLNTEFQSRQPYERALALLLEAQELSPDEGSPLMEAWAHYRLGDWASASKALSIMTESLAAKGFTPSADILVLSSLIHHHLGDRDKALQLLAQSQVTASISETMWLRLLPEAEKALGTPQAADQPEKWIGRRFMQRTSARVAYANGQTASGVYLPYLVTRVDGDRLWIGQNSIARTGVVPLENASRYYTQALEYIDMASMSPEFNRASVGMPKQELYNLRAIALKNAGETDQAIADYEAAIKLQPTDAAYHSNLANLYIYDLEKYDQALVETDAAIRLKPDEASYHDRRGYTLWKKGNLDEALKSFDEAIRLDPNLGYAYCARAYIWSAKGDREKMQQDLEEGVRRSPGDDSAWRNRAWLLATAPTAEHRDGEKAVAAATKACELSVWTNARNLDTLAAAHAELGNFPEAITWAEKALTFARNLEKTQIQSRLALYRQNKPYRDTPTYQPTQP